MRQHIDGLVPTEFVIRNGRYGLTADGELWRLGHHGYRAGYVMHAENFETAIDNHEEELRVLMAEARREFGL